jgi:valyl-tRNA synthetase
MHPTTEHSQERTAGVSQQASEQAIEMDRRFDPASYEPAWRRRWAEAGYFRAAAPTRRRPFCIVIPPPNVTGRLHVGHALQTATQDLLTRWRRMQGYEALYLPGTDHAGIATQLMIERQLQREGTSAKELGRERFLARAWAWKEEFHGNIRRQLDLLGASCDWTRERFTLDPGLSRAVREAFVRLYEEGLITRGEYLVNWSPVLETAVSDLEVEMRPVAGKLYHVAYPVSGSGGERVVVATTRPETMLGDTAVAYHPEDERYRHLAGRAAVLPLAGREIPFVADAAVDREFGTGLVKVTPFHDPFDFELARRHGLPGLSVIDRRGRMTEAAGPDFAGLDRAEARRKVVERLEAGGFLVRIEDHAHNVGHSQRSGEPIEPLVSTQWFLDVSGMAPGALASLAQGRLALVPESWGKTWEAWLGNIRPWCISRQLWWGHQIPAWYDADGKLYVARSREEAEAAAGTAELTQDPDVLDTWFSSALWPFSTLGWPDETADFATFYPTDVLVTGHDILFFWVARMVMMGLHFTGKEPFSQVHLTGLVRDAQGVKMSKTKGNVLDPEELVAEFGADAVRFTLASLDSPGRDIPLSREQMAGYRAFGNKIWNAARFALSRTGEARVAPAIDPAGLAAPERWILSRLSRTAGEVAERLATFRFDEACNRLYHFFWGDLCDWYIELAKPALMDAASPRGARAGEVLLSVLDRSLRLLHPVMPFLTEEIWQRLPGREAIHPETICLAPYPEREPAWEDAALEERFAVFMDVVGAVRGIRTSNGIAPKTRVELSLAVADDGVREFLAGEIGLVESLANARATIEANAAPAQPGTIQDVVRGVELAVFAGEVAAAARQRLERELADLAPRIAQAEGRLADASFRAKAPAEVIAKSEAKLAEMKERQATLRASLG